MSDKSIEEGDLLAFMYGESLPHVESALRASEQLRNEYAELRRSHAMLMRLFGGVERADAQDMVDEAMGTASPAAQLSVAAYVRNSSTGRDEMDLLRAVIAQEAAPSSARHLRFPQIALERVFSAAGARTANRGSRPSSREPISERYRTASNVDIAAQVSLQIIPPHRDRWTIRGRVTQQNAPVAAARVACDATTHSLTQTTTDERGAFEFEGVPDGTYRLEVELDQGTLYIEEIILQHG